MVKAIEWDDKYKLGVANIDAQHQELFLLYNGLVAAHNAGNAANIGAAFEALATYLDEHFSAEEKIWLLDKEIYREHRKYHFDFVKYVLHETADGTNFATLENLLEFLSTWLLDHIQTIDNVHYQQLTDKGLISHCNVKN